MHSAITDKIADNAYLDFYDIAVRGGEGGVRVDDSHPTHSSDVCVWLLRLSLRVFLSHVCPAEPLIYARLSALAPITPSAGTRRLN
jgi:hypothetical protein